MINTVRTVGGAITASCTKCKKVTRHLIVALVEDTPARVECRICGGVHNYRAPSRGGKDAPGRPAAASPGSPRTSRKSQKASAVEEEWRARVAKGARLDYSPTTALGHGDVIDHATFGLGWVRKAIPPNTIDVLFQDGFRKLRAVLR